MSELTDNSVVEGAGPFLFQTDELAPGERYTLDLREVEYQGSKRGLKRYTPFDVLSVSNTDTSASVLVTVNGQYEFGVFANTTEAFDRQGVSSVTVTNRSDTDTIPAGNVEIEVTREPFGADDEARRSAKTGPIVGTIEGVTGVDVSGFLGGGR